MIRTHIVIIILSISTSCSFSNSKGKGGCSVEEKIEKLENNQKLINWELNDKLIGNKINDEIQKAYLIDLLRNAFNREIEKPFMSDVFIDENKDLIDFYEYPKIHIGRSCFNSIYVNIKYEDGNYDLVIIYFLNNIKENNGLIIYEKLDAEVNYSRFSQINYPIIKTIFYYAGVEKKSQFFLIKNNLFLDYNTSTNSIQEYWNINWGKGRYKINLRNDNSAEYFQKGNFKNHLKDGKWTEKRYSFKNENSIISSCNYLKGLKHGFYSEIIPLEPYQNNLIYFGYYKNGEKKGVWKLKLQDSVILENKFYSTNSDLESILSSSIKQINQQTTDSIYNSWKGTFTINTIKFDGETNSMNLVTYSVGITTNKIFVSIDSKNTDDFFCEGEYDILSYNKAIIYCKGICDEYANYDFQLKRDNGHYFIKSDFFIIKEWQSISKL